MRCRKLYAALCRLCWGSNRRLPTTSWSAKTYSPSIDLATEIDSVQDRDLRLSRATIAPGGHVGLHSHQRDPTIVYLLSGMLTNHRDDGTTEMFREGQVFAE